MTDRELLEAAAEAAGMSLGKAQDKRWFYCEHGQCGEGMYLIHENLLEFWNPQTDDGDAFRLAVKLGEKFPCFMMGIFSRSAFPYASASIVHRNGDETYIEQDDNADMAETARRAIVRAAAALTPSMESNHTKEG